jgi:4,5-DOPA dioxygenase extradiol
LTALGRALPKPQAVLVVSPHWTTPSMRVGAVALPKTIHDFGGFAPALYELNYPVHGHPALAARTQAFLNAAGWSATPDEHRGLDHGAWVPLRYLYPDANVPAFQVSMPASLDSASAYEFGKALAPLAEEGVLIVGSGSLTHNLYEFRSAGNQEPAYAKEFVAWVRDTVASGDQLRLQQTLQLAPNAQRAHPTPEHFLPLLVAAGAAAGGGGSIQVLDGGFTHGVLSMESYVFGNRRVEVPASSFSEAAHA